MARQIRDYVTRAFEVKSLEDKGEFTGLASVYGNVDLGGDVISPGAFTKTLAEKGVRRTLRDSHRFPVGIVTLSDSDVGLEAHGKLNLEKESARDIYSDVKFFHEHGMSYGMSIGFIPMFDKMSIDKKTGIRTLNEVKLYEVSLTDLPMNEEARTMSVKSDQPEDGLIEELALFLDEVKAGRAISASRAKRIRDVINELSALLMEAGDPTSEDGAAPKSIEPAVPLGLLDRIAEMRSMIGSH